MANSKTKTLWVTNGRAPDSRDILDDNGGLRRGRVDIDGSLMVNVDGYSKVVYKRITSDGEVGEYDSIVEALTLYSKAPVVETKPGSGIMTFFVDGSDAAYPGIIRIDVYKEWEVTDPEPELTPNDWPRQTLYAGTMGLGLDFVFRNGETRSSAARGGSVINRMGMWAAHDNEYASFAKLVLKAISKASPEDLKAIKDALGITAA